MDGAYDLGTMGKYKRLDLDERENISRYLADNKSLAEIAVYLGRSKSTISRELKQAGMTKKTYRAIYAQFESSVRLVIPKRKSKIAGNPRLQEYIHEHLRLYWSPEQIAHELKLLYSGNMAMQASHETIYTYIYILARGSLKEELKSYLRQRRRLRRKRGLNHQKRGAVKDIVSIEERPKEAANRTIPGHWEGDLIMGRYHASALGTLVERTTRTTILVPLKKKDAVSVRRAFARELKRLPRQMKISLTYDRGSEMAEHKLFTRQTKIKVYFAHPYCPWERGTNENTNGLIRQFFPKGTNFKGVSSRKIKHVQDLLNGRPRKVLGYQTPYEVFNQALR